MILKPTTTDKELSDYVYSILESAKLNQDEVTASQILSKISGLRKPKLIELIGGLMELGKVGVRDVYRNRRWITLIYAIDPLAIYQRLPFTEFSRSGVEGRQ